MPRVLTSFDDYDETGQHRPIHGDWLDRDREREAGDLGRHRVRLNPYPVPEQCQVCGRERVAELTCPACGDTDEMGEAA